MIVSFTASVHVSDEVPNGTIGQTVTQTHSLSIVENSVLLKCRKLRREDQETSDSIVSRISLFYDMCCYLQSSKISS